MEFVNFEIAKKLKEKGYPQVKKNTIAMYSEYGGWFSLAKNLDDFEYSFVDFDEYDYVCPTISQVLKWLREGKKMFVCAYIMSDVSLDADGNIVDCWKYWMFDISSTSDAHRIYTEELNEFESYEEAALAGIEYVLNNLI